MITFLTQVTLVQVLRLPQLPPYVMSIVSSIPVVMENFFCDIYYLILTVDIFFILVFLGQRFVRSE